MLHGAIVVDKPGGMTSHDVVAGARRALGTRSIGHAGTLDPMATGVLVLLVGEALKLSGYVTSDAKRYVARVAFGRSTDSDDATGATREERELSLGWLDAQRFFDAIQAETARTLQVPPSVSAIHVAGERAHRLSRKGQAPELAPRAVRVEELRAIDFDDQGARFELCVSKGYYVRALARDLGAALGVPAHLAELRRIASGRFSLEDANPWPLPASPELVPLLETAKRSIPLLELNAEGARRASLGQSLDPNHLVEAFPASATEAETFALWAGEGALVALARPVAGGTLRVIRGFVPG